ncbi:M23 family metallopeptidase [Nemorincola caseinilytica]|uniref:M23 family metallopeptidase n=1 Tax=Nemorincola caseinilytica TaxID=2054315 RepID=A0ABP8NRW9_9BACT
MLPLVCAAQEPGSPYPQDLFRNPLDIPISLAGNFGECRPGHFHSGLDIRTQGREDLPVYAAAEGYISRIKTDKGGFGHAIYITHPNGYTTLYAHLNKYIPFLQTYLRQQQYERKRWDVDISLKPSQFPVRKGQQIAWSGNTGSSSAPHLHFEIRNSETEHPLNPQLFGLRVEDDIAPTIREVVFYGSNVYEGAPITVAMAKQGSRYKPTRAGNSRLRMNNDTLEVQEGLVGVGINVDDYMNGSENTITFYIARLFLDGEQVSKVTMDDIGYDESRYVNAYTDHKTRQQTKRWVQCMFKVPGNKLTRIYKFSGSDGRIDLTDKATHELKIEITDNNGNTSTATMYVSPCIREEAPAADAECTPFRVGKVNEYSGPGISFTIDERQLYDDICLSVRSTPDAAALSEKYRVHYPYIPLHHYFDLKVKPSKTIPFDLRSKVALMYTDGKDTDGKEAASVENGWYKASVRNFGTYWLALDTTAPVIRSVHKNGADLSRLKQLTLTVKDDMTSVRSFSGTIDGEWVCFEQHGNSFFYEFDEHCTRGRHELVFKAEDENGNKATYKLDLSR